MAGEQSWLTLGLFVAGPAVGFGLGSGGAGAFAFARCCSLSWAATSRGSGYTSAATLTKPAGLAGTAVEDEVEDIRLRPMMAELESTVEQEVSEFRL